jgi:hypothetical protein
VPRLDAAWTPVIQPTNDSGAGHEADVRAFDHSVMGRDGPIHKDGLTPLEQTQLLKRYVRRQEYEQCGVRWHLAQTLAMLGDDVAAAEQALLSINHDEATDTPGFSWNTLRAGDGGVPS